MRIVLKFAGIALLLICAAFLATAAPLYWQQYRVMKAWPGVQATVLRGEVIRHITTAGEPLYGARLMYAFEAGGRGYRAAYEFPHDSTHLERKEKQLAKHPPGSREWIRYNPADPTDIRIRVGYNVEYFVVPVFITGLGLICAVLAAVLLLLARLGASPRAGLARNDISATSGVKTG